MNRLTVTRSGPLVGTLRPPSDKSLTHRALMLGAASTQPSEINQPLIGMDCMATIGCLAQMGLTVRGSRHDRIELTPAPYWVNPIKDLYCGNSGTTMRLLSGLIASRELEARLVGDESLSKRPMKRIAEPLRLMGAHIKGDKPPLNIKGGQLLPIEYETPTASAQVKSAILLAALKTYGPTAVIEPAQSRNHTELMLGALGAPIVSLNCQTVFDGPYEIPGFQFEVPGDISSAAFWICAAVLVPGSKIELTDVGLNPTRTGILDVLEQCGADFETNQTGTELGEPKGTITIRHQDGLRPFRIMGELVPRLIDEIPVLAVLATQCTGETIISDAGELRVKESDRIAVVTDTLRSMGAKIEARPDGMVIDGPTPLEATSVDSDGDHRIAMAFAIAGLIAEGETVITGAETINTSYPDFLDHLNLLQG